MGCDIHAHLEVKINYQWQHYSAPVVEINYWLFEKMAGVRGEVENAIIPPRGLPEDITILTLLDYRRDQSDWHTPSWFGVEEIRKLEEALYLEYGNIMSYNINFGIFHTYLFENSFTAWYDYPEENTVDIQDFRIVFWFDS